MNNTHSHHGNSSDPTPSPRVIDTVETLPKLWPATASGVPHGQGQPPKQILMVDPASFRITSTINVHMKDASGKPHTVDTARARRQWQALVEVYRKLVPQVHILEPKIDPHVDLPDIVFCANQTFPFVSAGSGEKKVLLSEMHSPTRKPEVPFFQRFFEQKGYTCVTQPADHIRDLEGMGDLLSVFPQAGRSGFICAGHGQRTDRKALDWVAQETGQTVMAFELRNPKFYHLDTCLSVLNAETALACQQGFTPQGWSLLKKLFPNIIEAPLEECDAPGFAANCHSPDGKTVVIQKGNTLTNQALRQAGFDIIEVETDEFIKAGGSVFCMKLMFF